MAAWPCSAHSSGQNWLRGCRARAGSIFICGRPIIPRLLSSMDGFCLLVTQTGGMAAVAVTFARYYREITGFSAGDGPIAAAALMGLTAINCFGVRAGSNVQSALMLLKAAAIAAMVVAGILWGGGAVHSVPLLDRPVSLGTWKRDRRGDDSGCLRLRRLADRELRGRRNARPAARPLPRPDCGRDRSGAALSRGQFRVRACARPRGAGGDPHSRVVGDARSTG